MYFPKVEEQHPGALTSQWIPVDPVLWKVSNYMDFLEARKVLLAEETNHWLEDLLHGETRWLEGTSATVHVPQGAAPILGGITSEAEEEELLGCVFNVRA